MKSNVLLDAVKKLPHTKIVVGLFQLNPTRSTQGKRP